MAELTMFKRTHVDLLLVRTELSLGVEEEKHGVGRNADRLFTVGVLNFHLDSRPLHSLREKYSYSVKHMKPHGVCQILQKKLLKELWRNFLLGSIFLLLSNRGQVKNYWLRSNGSNLYETNMN